MENRSDKGSLSSFTWRYGNSFQNQIRIPGVSIELIVAENISEFHLRQNFHFFFPHPVACYQSFVSRKVQTLQPWVSLSPVNDTEERHVMESHHSTVPYSTAQQEEHTTENFVIYLVQTSPYFWTFWEHLYASYASVSKIVATALGFGSWTRNRIHCMETLLLM